MALDIRPELIKPYLKMITEAVVIDSNNKGSLRKDLWDYLLKKYQKSVDYRDFLLAIRRFLIDGKMNNREGYFSMHPEVINEVKEKTPTPAIKKITSAAAASTNPENGHILHKDQSSQQSKKSQKTIKISETS